MKQLGHEAVSQEQASIMQAQGNTGYRVGMLPLRNCILNVSPIMLEPSMPRAWPFLNVYTNPNFPIKVEAQFYPAASACHFLPQMQRPAGCLSLNATYSLAGSEGSVTLSVHKIIHVVTRYMVSTLLSFPNETLEALALASSSTIISYLTISKLIRTLNSWGFYAR